MSNASDVINTLRVHPQNSNIIRHFIFFLHIPRKQGLTLKASSALSSAGYFKSHCCKRCGPRSDCSFRSSLIWVHTVCLYAKCKFEKFARRCSRRHKQTTFSDVDCLGPLRVKISFRESFSRNCIHLSYLFDNRTCNFIHSVIKAYVADTHYYQIASSSI